MSSRFKLKLLNGNLRKREVQLPAGEWRIGGPRSDFAVRLDGNAEAVLCIDDESGVELLGSAPYWVAGKRKGYPSGPLPLGVPIEVAGLGIMLGGVDDTLPDRKLPPRVSRRRRAVIITASAVGVIACVATMAVAILVLPPNFRPAPVGPQAIAPAVRQDLEHEGVKIDFRAGAVVLSGTCENRGALARSIHMLSARGVAVVDNVVCEDDLVRSVSAVLHLYGVNDAVVSAGDNVGYVRIAGHISSDTRWSIVSSVLASMPALKGWELTGSGSSSTVQLTDSLRKAGILDELSVFKSSDAILVSGKLGGSEGETLRRIIERFEKAHPSGPRVIHQDIAPQLPAEAIFPAQLVSIGGDRDHAFVVLANGQRYLAGDTLPSGFRIMAIHADGVDVERDGDFMHVLVPTDG